MRIRRFGSVLSAAALAASLGGASVQADAATGTPRLQKLATAQTRLYAALDDNTGVSPPRCGQGQRLHGVHGVFLLPVFAGTNTPEPKTLRCTTTAHQVLVDAGGFAVTEDNNGPSWPLPSPDGELVPFDRQHLDAICDDVVENFLPDNGISPAVVTVDGEVTQPVAVATHWFIARHSPTLETQYADSIALGHPGRLATDFCGYKSLLHLRPGRHVVTVDYSLNAGASGTLYTYRIHVRPGGCPGR
jgi:hypothetical protein